MMRRRARPIRLAAALLLAWPGGAGAEPAWPVALWDPAAEAGEPADLVLPMPCGGAMAFQRVAVPVAADDPLSDRRVRLGRAADASGVSDYLWFAFLRGAFDDPGGAGSAFYVARYELTQGQRAALAGEGCREAGRADRLAQGGLSWFDAVALGRAYSEWLRAEAPEALPLAGDEPAFVRLPTEVEWEFAARGGAAVGEAEFGAPLFPMEGPIEGYARAGGEDLRDVGPVGRLGPNPLGLYDVYGNAEELILEPFRLNAAGRPHGQPGGLVTRGGSYATRAADLSSALRVEWRAYDREGRAQSQGSFGARFVLSATASGSDERLRELDESFGRRLAAPPPEALVDPLAELDRLIGGEAEPERRVALEGLRGEFAVAAQARRDAEAQVVAATVRSAFVLLDSVRRETDHIAYLANALALHEEFLAMDHDLSDPDEAEEVARFTADRDELDAALGQREGDRAVLLGAYRAVLLLFASGDLDRAMIDAAAADIGAELGRAERLRTPLADVLADVAAFAARPDMDDAALLDLALGAEP